MLMVRKRRSSLALCTLPAIIMLVMMLQSGHSLRWCGQISSVNMDADVNTQRHKLSTAWRGFDGSADETSPVRYEWAIMSEGSALSESLNGASLTSRCVTLTDDEEAEQKEAMVGGTLNRRSVAAPDVHNWQSVGVSENEVRNFEVPAEVSAKFDESKRYQVLVKAVYEDGGEVLTRSHAFGTRSLSRRDECGDANLCRVQRMLVRDILTERFGPTVSVFNFVPGELPDGDDDDDNLSGGVIAGITVSVVFFVLLVLIVLLAFTRGRGSSGPFRSDGVAGVTEAERTGPRGALKTDDQNTAVVIQYPDTGLDLDREIMPAGDDAAAVEKDGVRPQLSGILESKTPSGRDYSTQM